MSPRLSIAIIGAGIIGTACAHALLDDGHQVTLVDPDGIGQRTSRGNAGWIAHHDRLPLAGPKTWARIPRWALDRNGPLTWRWQDLPSLSPFLWGFAKAGLPARREAATRALSAINAQADGAWHRRLAALGAEARILRHNPILCVWQSPRGWQEARRHTLPALQARACAFETMEPDAIRRLEPALTGPLAGGVLFTGSYHVSDPAEVVGLLGQEALARQAQLRQMPVTAIEPGPGQMHLRLGDGSLASFDRIVLAAGVWSRSLARAMGDPVPLAAERGYNLTAPPGTLGLSRPIQFEEEGFVITPLDIGDRIGGQVELADPEAPPHPARVDRMLARLIRYLPQWKGREIPGTRWMGNRPSLPDSIPVIGPSRREPRLIYAFGHGHYGLTQATATAEIVAALLAGREPPIPASPYAVTRFA